MEASLALLCPTECGSKALASEKSCALTNGDGGTEETGVVMIKRDLVDESL